MYKLDSEKIISVYKKVLSQKNAFIKNKFETVLIGFDDKNVYIIDEKFFKSYKQGNYNILGKMFFRYQLVNKICRVISDFKPDYIYMRDTLWFFNLHKKLSNTAPVYIEVQSKIIDELKIVNIKRYIFEKLLKRRYFKSISGFVCITDEILKCEMQYNKKRGFILGNGINKDEINFIPIKSNNDYINLLFMGSPDIPWHGVQRLIISLKKAAHKDRFMLHIAGYKNEFNINDNNIKFYGLIKDEKKIYELFSICDIGIGTLALYKKNMKEAAPLKVRHYLAKGLPVIIAYDDTDLNYKLPFVMHVSNDDSFIDFNEVEKFYTRTKDIRHNGDTVKFVLDNLTWDKKIKKVSKFIIEEKNDNK